MNELIITACAADCSIYPDMPVRLHESDALAIEVEAAYRAGAAIAHIHAPPGDYARWASHTRAIRDRCGVMIQYGISIQDVEQRREVVKNRPEMISVALGAHNLAFIGRDLMKLHPREELAELMRLCRDHFVKPEFEVCALGDLWLLDDLAQKGLVEPPFMVTLFFGRPGGTWSPASIEEFLHRSRALPGNTHAFASVTGASHLQIETLAVLTGHHVRVGTEDEPHLSPGVLGDNEDHVARMTRIAHELGREVADVATARHLLAIPA